ncbi:putative hemin transport protein [Inquilinus ginsengisoli]|uniref:Hemin transport protein n=1 Tax=Inquilinus ginsengisoli TaxID=363840 RepID=A0ABU1JVY5_9PROT|nr:ChuX/HutX family heme-like substrate-binding protein [Inquilinus ginsengisoli]MDR6292760.1 putative hemin transport protein [Inquilinus ginsengisoli]
MQSLDTLAGTAPALAARWAALREERPQLRARDAAAALGVSEGELVASGTGAGTTRIGGEWSTILQAVEGLGPVMALTRNESVVHEKIGTYQNVSAGSHVGLALGADIDLRLFYTRWKHGFAVGGADHPKPSLQFFDAAGTAVHKIYLTDDSDRAAFAALTDRFRHDDQAPVLIPEAVAAKAVLDDAEIDVAGFHAGWDAMEDTHQFFGLLKTHRLDRLQAMRLAAPARAEPVAHDTLRRLLTRAAAGGESIMVFVGNPGCIQIHTGPVHTLKDAGPWLNLLDPGFNLHLREDRIASSWIVRKPTKDGTVTSLELFDVDGTLMAMLFGARKPGQPERADWRALIDAVGAEAVA